MKWKRTRASVALDLWTDPANDDDKGGFIVDTPIPGYRSVNKWQVSRVVERVCKAALREFDTVNEVSDLEAVFDLRSKRKYRGLSTDNYVQFRLAWSLTKRAVGDEAGADALLEQWIATMSPFKPKIDASMIAKANSAARALAGTSNVPA